MSEREEAGVVPETVAPCGLYCGVCRMYTATQEGDLELLARLARIYARRLEGVNSLTADDLLCDGCLSERRSFLCRSCSIRNCIQEKGYQGCHQCRDFPCDLIDAFPIAVGKRVILRAIPYWRVHGTEMWVKAEEERYRCPDCGGKTFRGADWCPHCRTRVSLD